MRAPTSWTRLARRRPTEMDPAHRWIEVPDGEAKTAKLHERIFEGAVHPTVRDIAVRLIAGTDRNDHRERIARLHRFVRDVVDYHREPVEMFQHASWTLRWGGDCDCLVILLASLAWSLRYPWIVEVHGGRDDPLHYSLTLGWPPSDSPTGDRETQWVHAEVSAAAVLGERTQDAAARRAPL
jgi:hypothetical protein